MQEEIIITQAQGMPPMAEGIGLGMIIVMLVIYAFWAFCMARIAVKLGMPFGTAFIWALIPIANVFLFLKLAAKPWWWFFLLLVPILNIVMIILIWMALCERLGKPGWWGVLIAIVPVVNLVFFLMLVFGKEETPRPAMA
jgi:hypothetical protein